MAELDNKEFDVSESRQLTTSDSHEVDNLNSFRSGTYSAESANFNRGSANSVACEQLPTIILHDETSGGVPDDVNRAGAGKIGETGGDTGAGAGVIAGVSADGNAAQAADGRGAAAGDMGTKAADDATQFVSARTSDAAMASKGDDGGWHKFWGEYVDPQDINTGRRAVGSNLMDHLNDQKYLEEHHDDLKHGLEEAYSHMTPEAFERFVGELNKKSGGKIYIEHGNGLLGSLNPLNPPGSQVVRVYLHRGGLHSDYNVMDSRDQTSSPVYASGKPFDSRH